MTVDLNLTNAEFIQFYFMYGCMTPPSNRNQCVLLEFSLNGGINWIVLTEIFYDLYRKPGWAFFMKNRYTHTLLITPSAPTVCFYPKVFVRLNTHEKVGVFIDLQVMKYSKIGYTVTGNWL